MSGYTFDSRFTETVKKLNTARVGSVVSFYFATSPSGDTAGIVARKATGIKQNSAGKLGRKMRDELGVKKFARGVMVKTTDGIVAVSYGGNINVRDASRIIGKKMFKEAENTFIKQLLKNIEIKPKDYLTDVKNRASLGLEETERSETKTTETKTTDTSHFRTELASVETTDSLNEGSIEQEYTEQASTRRKALQEAEDELLTARSILVRVESNQPVSRDTRQPTLTEAREMVRLSSQKVNAAKKALAESLQVGGDLVSSSNQGSEELKTLGQLGQQMLLKWQDSSPDLLSTVDLSTLLTPLGINRIDDETLTYQRRQYAVRVTDTYREGMLWAPSTSHDLATAPYPAEKELVTIRNLASDLSEDLAALQTETTSEEGSMPVFLEPHVIRTRAHRLTEEVAATLKRKLEALNSNSAPVLVVEREDFRELVRAVRAVEQELSVGELIGALEPVDQPGTLNAQIEKGERFDDLYTDTGSGAVRPTRLSAMVPLISVSVRAGLKSLQPGKTTRLKKTRRYVLLTHPFLPAVVYDKASGVGKTFARDYFRARQAQLPVEERGQTRESRILAEDGYTSHTGQYLLTKNKRIRVAMDTPDPGALHLLINHLKRGLKLSVAYAGEALSSRTPTPDSPDSPLYTWLKETKSRAEQEASRYNDTLSQQLDDRIEAALRSAREHSSFPPTTEEEDQIREGVTRAQSAQKLTHRLDHLLMDPTTARLVIDFSESIFSAENIMFLVAVHPRLAYLRPAFPALSGMTQHTGEARVKWICDTFIKVKSTYEINISYTQRSAIMDDYDKGLLSSSVFRQFWIAVNEVKRFFWNVNQGAFYEVWPALRPPRLRS